MYSNDYDYRVTVLLLQYTTGLSIKAYILVKDI